MSDSRAKITARNAAGKNPSRVTSMAHPVSTFPHSGVQLWRPAKAFLWTLSREARRPARIRQSRGPLMTTRFAIAVSAVFFLESLSGRDHGGRSSVLVSGPGLPSWSPVLGTRPGRRKYPIRRGIPWSGIPPGEAISSVDLPFGSQI